MNPPFDISGRGGDRLRDRGRWKYGVPPTGNANCASVQRLACHVVSSGDAGFVLANGSFSLGRSNEGEKRRNLLEADLMDCMVALPGHLFLAYHEHLFEPRAPRSR